MGAGRGRGRGREGQERKGGVGANHQLNRSQTVVVAGKLRLECKGEREGGLTVSCALAGVKSQ